MSSDRSSIKSFELNFFKNLRSPDKNNGYLVCHKCYGYYPLKENELPGDFAECECGNDLEFYENIDDLIKSQDLKNPDADKNNSKMLHDDYKELQEIANVLKSKSEKRKEFFEELSTRIEIQEEILNDIKYGEWKLWDAIEEKSLYNNNGQKFVVENFIEQENNFLSYIKEQRSKAANTENKSFTHTSVKISALLIFILAIVLVIFFMNS
jgi:hypothetical protein